MSRLQVGGLALIIKGKIDHSNVGKTVTLVSFNAEDGKWVCECKEGFNVIGSIEKKGLVHYSRLIPLGDKQTQDELAKERSHDFV